MLPASDRDTCAEGWTRRLIPAATLALAGCGSASGQTMPVAEAVIPISRATSRAIGSDPVRVIEVAPIASLTLGQRRYVLADAIINGEVVPDGALFGRGYGARSQERAKSAAEAMVTRALRSQPGRARPMVVDTSAYAPRGALAGRFADAGSDLIISVRQDIADITEHLRPVRGLGRMRAIMVVESIWVYRRSQVAWAGFSSGLFLAIDLPERLEDVLLDRVGFLTGAGLSPIEFMLP